jgi:exosome complex RNA-binding protein Csl4
VPWADLAISREDGAIVLINQYVQLALPESPKTLLDRSPRLEDLDRLVQELQATIPADLKAPEHRSTESNQPTKDQKANCPDPQTIKGDVVRGQVVDAQDNFLIIKDSSGTLIHVHKDPCTHQVSQRIRSGLFLPGDMVEAYVTPKGHAISLSMLRPASYASVPD